MRTGWIDRAVDAVSDGGIGASVLIVAPLAVLGGLGVGMYGFLRNRRWFKSTPMAAGYMQWILR